MAVVAVSVETLKTHKEKTWVYTWSNMANGDTGEPIEMPSCADRTVQVVGTFGTGGTLKIQGSNDGTNYPVLDDVAGDPVSFTTAGLDQILPVPRYMRPAVTAGDGSTSLTVIILVRRN